ncbi:hypothetical protein NHQ30_004846 [Ciborinia camelliae]|nr:hypothetical protein NHQ30_004846 [Ciborinia camelliae]
MTNSIIPHIQSSHLPSHIIYQNDHKTITLIDIPRSVEDAQYLLSEEHAGVPCPNVTRRLISCKPVETPYESLEPKSKKALQNVPEKTIKELMLERYVQLALDEMMEDARWEGTFCLNRVYGKDEKKKRKRESVEEELGKSQHDVIKVENDDCVSPKRVKIDGMPGTMPPRSTMIHGNIPEANGPVNLDQSEGFPNFHVIIVDPPWPNRSALRKDAYATASGSMGIANLLRWLPCDHIEDNGYVGIWVTNKPAFRAMILDEGGLFDQWGLELVEEWIWLKVTSSGEPIYEITGTWRKPWEILLVGRKIGIKKELVKTGSDYKREPAVEKKIDIKVTNATHQSPITKSDTNKNTPPTTCQSPDSTSNTPNTPNASIKRRVIIGVPDLHSRKPNLRYLFRQLLEGYNRNDNHNHDYSNYMGLEIFARNLTAGWWGWGNEVAKFQMDDFWVGEEEGEEGEEGEIDADPTLRAPNLTIGELVESVPVVENSHETR